MGQAKQHQVGRGRSARPNRARLRKIRLFAMDVDGVLTDGGMYLGESGEELKKFHARDGMGIKLLQAAGLITSIVTMEKTKLVARRGANLGIPEVHQGVRNKLGVLQDLAGRYGLTMDEVAFIGDDVNDLAALQGVGFSATPADGVAGLRKVVRYVCQSKGGEGAVREVVDLILAAQSSPPRVR